MLPVRLRSPRRSADSVGIRVSSLSRLGVGATTTALVTALAFSSGGYPPSDHGVLVLVFALVVLVVALVADEAPLDMRGLTLVGALAGLALWQLASVAWAGAATWPVLEAERGLVYATAAAALVLVVKRELVAALAAGIVVGATVASLYGLATRLFPGRVGGPYDPAAGYQLAEPIGYWNALGLLLALVLLLGVGLALHGQPRLRVTAGPALVPLAAGLYFTFSRGAMVALLTGLLVLLLLDRRARVGLPLLALAPLCGVLLASRSPALTRAGETLQAAQAQGQRLALELAVLACAGAAVVSALPRIERRVSSRLPGARVVTAGLLVGVTAVAVLGAVRGGGPAEAADRALAAFRGEPPAAAGSLDRRLLSLSGHGRADYWRVAMRMVEREPLLGEGAGGFERRWTEERPAPNNARDAHNLYLETLAELGPLGLVLLGVALGAPLTGLGRARQQALGPAAAAAYCAFLLHAGLDWDWELPVLALPALACAVILVAEARTAAPVPLTALGRGAGVGVAMLAIAVGLVAHVGNRALAEGVSALERADPESAASAARRAQSWAPWSHEPWQLLGEAQLAERDDAEARRSLAEAVRRAPEEWRPWLDLAIVSAGPSRQRAITRARDLNPLGPEISDLNGR